ncbi:MAG: hypothetical protein LBK71_07985 [Verrucomicrobiales bacterium]|nr:hypothetical protein [Verrucomicrobiales bacterium]
MSTQFIKPLIRNYLPSNEDQAFLWLLNPVAIPGDIIVLGAKAYTAKHSEGANYTATEPTTNMATKKHKTHKTCLKK